MDKQSLYSNGGGQAEKFREIDKFLKLTERQTNDNTKKIKTWGRVAGAVGTVLFVIIGLATGSAKAYIGAALFLAIGVYFGFIMHKKPYMPLVRTEKIIEIDGIENVHYDLMHCSRIERSDLYISEHYLFKQGNYMVRLSDVRRCYISNEEGSEGTEYYCDIDISDETGTETLELRRLSTSNEQRQKQFEAINKPIEAAKIRIV